MSKGTKKGRGSGPEGEITRYGPTGRAQRIKTGGAQWSDEAEELFLDVLASCGNVRFATRATGFTTPTVYRQRRLRADFAEKWWAAVDQGYVRLEMALLEAANDTMAGKEFDPDRPIPKMTVEQAMNVLRAHQHGVRGDGRRGPGRRGRQRTLDEVKDSIAKKVHAIKAARKDGAGEDGADAA